jgi:hypothetical protein
VKSKHSLSLRLLSFTAVAALCAVLLTAKPASAVLIEYEVFFSDPRISGTITFESDDFSPNATNVIAVDFLFTDTVTGGIWNQGDAHVLGSPFFKRRSTPQARQSSSWLESRTTRLFRAAPEAAFSGGLAQQFPTMVSKSMRS